MSGRGDQEAVARSAQRLGVRLNADLAAIRQAYVRQVKLWHPDRNGDADASMRFEESRQAYRTLLSHARGRPVAVPAAPARCRRCGRSDETLTPRQRLTVRAYGIGTRVERSAAIECRACARRSALAANLRSTLFGWWSPAGPFHVLHAARANLADAGSGDPVNLRLALRPAGESVMRPDGRAAFVALNLLVVAAVPVAVAAGAWLLW